MCIRDSLGVDPDDDVAAVAAVATVGPAEGLELLAVHGGAPVTALAGGDGQRHPIDERGGLSLIHI